MTERCSHAGMGRETGKAEVTDIFGLPEKFKIRIKRRGLKKKMAAAL